MRKFVLITAAAAGLAGVAYVYLGNVARSGPPANVAPNCPTPVTAGLVEEKEIPIFCVGLGTVQAFNTVTVKVRNDVAVGMARDSSM